MPKKPPNNLFKNSCFISDVVLWGAGELKQYRLEMTLRAVALLDHPYRLFSRPSFKASKKKQIFNSLKWIYLSIAIFLLCYTSTFPPQSSHFRPNNCFPMALLLYVMLSKLLIVLFTFTWSLLTSLFKCSARKWAESPSWGFINTKQSLPVSYRQHPRSRHAEFVLFTTTSYCWLLAGLCFTVISKSFPVGLLYLSLFFILSVCLIFPSEL